MHTISEKITDKLSLTILWHGNQEVQPRIPRKYYKMDMVAKICEVQQMR